jgi:hypothetical protein
VTNPFDILALSADSDPTDDDVRSAWRRVAAATHPDREDGGDPAAFAAAAAAYTLLRTAAGRVEALADMTEPGGSAPGGPVTRKYPLARAAATAAWRIRHGRPARLAARLLAAVATGAVAVAGVGWQPASAAAITGTLTWLALSARHDLATRRR